MIELDATPKSKETIPTMRFFTTTLISFLTIGCTHTITVDETAQTEVEDCKINVVDARTDRQIITPQPGTTYSYPEEYPVVKAIRNTLCHSQAKSLPLTVYLEQAKCQMTGGFSKHEMALKVSVEGSTTPIVSVMNEDSGTVMIGKHCGYNLTLAMQAISAQITELAR